MLVSFLSCSGDILLMKPEVFLIGGFGDFGCLLPPRNIFRRQAGGFLCSYLKSEMKEEVIRYTLSVFVGLWGVKGSIRNCRVDLWIFFSQREVYISPYEK